MYSRAQVKCLVFILGFLHVCAAREKEGVSRILHRLTKRQTAEELGPIPYTARRNAPIPYQQGHEASQSDVTGGNDDSSDPSARDYTGLYPNYAEGDTIDDWSVSSDVGRASYSSQSGSDQTSSSRFSGTSNTGGPSATGRHYYRYQPPVSTSRGTGGIPTETHYSDTTRYSGGRGQGRTYTYPFGGGAGGGSVGGGGGAGHPDPALAGQFYGSTSISVSTREQGDSGSEGEPVVTVFPSEQPVNPTYSSRQEYDELLRQRNAERQRLLQERQQRQQQQGGTVPQGQQRPMYTGSEQLGGSVGRAQGQPIYRSGERRPVYTGLTAYSARQQPAHTPGGPGPFQPTYAGQQQPLYNFGYTQPGYDAGSYSSECPNTGIRIQINGIPCEVAIDRYGSYLCYRHEYTSQECCQKCLTLKNAARIGCEYGDHSGRCAQLQSFDCYDLRNRQSCCHTCERLQRPGARSGCEYGDMTPNCERVRQSPGLCYIPENRYLCCDTCNNIRVGDNSECPWGDHNQELCELFDRDGNIRINCYAAPIRRICCQACQRLQEWIRADLPGCEYGDKPVTFNTGTHRNLNCTSFMRYFGQEQCTVNQAVGSNCCYTCHRYSQG